MLPVEVWMFYENFRGCLSDIYQNQDKTKNEKQEKQPQQNNEGQDTKETFKEMIALLMWVDSLPHRHLSITIWTYPDRNAIIIILYLLFNQSLPTYPGRNWVFMMFAVSNFLTSLGYPIPYTFVPVKIDLGALDCASNNKITCHNMRIMYSITLHRIMPSNWESTLNKEAQLLE